MMQPILYIVVPCYNEEAVLNYTSETLLNKVMQLIGLEAINKCSKILFVDDGSTDATWDIIKTLSEQDTHFCGIRQSRNRGHQNTVLAGLMEVKDKCDISITIDCDGQDDINAIDQMVQKYKEGFEIVYGVRNNRTSDAFLKKWTAETFYKLLMFLGGNIVFNHADYRLISSKVLQELANFNEVNLFLRGIIPQIGFRSTCVYYERTKRIAGKSHYSIQQMLSLAINGITSLSTRPLQMITHFGLFIAFVSFLGVIWSVTMFFAGKTVSGWASTTSIICFVSGVQLIFMGIIGEYIGKIYLESKHRPRYIISERTKDDE